MSNSAYLILCKLDGHLPNQILTFSIIHSDIAFTIVKEFLNMYMESAL